MNVNAEMIYCDIYLGFYDWFYEKKTKASFHMVDK